MKEALHILKERYNNFRDCEHNSSNLIKTHKLNKKLRILIKIFKYDSSPIHLVYPLDYRLIILALILPIGIACVERAFSDMKIVNQTFCSRMRDEWFNDYLIPYIEIEVLPKFSMKLLYNTIKI